MAVLGEAWSIDDLKLKLANTNRKKSCLSDLPIARKIYEKENDNLAALQVIADCSQSQAIDHYATGMKEILEGSHILSIIPKILDMAQVKDLIPILREVEVKDDKDLTDYLMINEIYDRLGQPDKQMDSLKMAIEIAPGDPRPIMILALKNFDDSQNKEKEGLLKSYLTQNIRHPGRIYLMMYVLALVYPLTASLLLLFTIWILGSLIGLRKIRNLTDWRKAKFGLPMFILILPTLLAFRFWQSHQALPLGVLLILIFIQVFILANPILVKFYRPVFKFIGRVIYFIFNGTILAKRLARFSLASRGLIAIVTLTVLGVIVPTIESPDIKYGTLVLSSLILYGTIGSLMISFMRSRESLVTTLRWIAITATVPFLISYIVANWEHLGSPLLYGELPTKKTIDSLMSYLAFWGGSLFLATHLGKIMAEAFIQPINEIMATVAQIEQGQFKAKVEVYSKDEIGHLGNAVNRMGSGLEKREMIEKTFSRYVDKKIAQRILDGVESELRVAGQTVQATVLFCDMRGFTSFSEKTSAEEVVRLLNQFFERVVHVVQEHQGVVDKFIGDNLMAVWGVPNPVDNAEINATHAALKMIQEVDAWNIELEALGLSSVGVGIGLNCGPVVAGSIGSMDRMEYTVIGDTVNTAQRAESSAKRQQLIVTQAMHEKIKDKFECTALPPITVKGKLEPQNWFVVNGEKVS